MMHYLDIFLMLIERLRATNSRTEKEAILLQYWNDHLQHNWELDKLFHAVYDYDKQYYVTSANILKKDLIQPGLFVGKKYERIWSLLDDLSNRVITGHNAIIAVQQFLKQHNEDQQKLILDIIDKDLKCGLSEVTINKIIPNLIPQFKVALAQKLDKEILDKSYVISRKLDGCRCIAICKNKDDIKFFSRQGKEFDTLDVVRKDIQKLFEIGVIYNNTVLDGEICIIDNNGKEDFQSVMKEIKRKDHTIQNPMYIMFDLLTLEEFNKGTSKFNYRNRIMFLRTIDDCITELNPEIKPKHLRIVEWFDYTPEEFKKWQQKVIDNGWEGLIARKDVYYENKRSKNMLKIKSFQDEEFKVLGVEEGDAQEVINGVAHKIKCVGSLVIEYKGNKVNVGTGLSLEQRKRWYEHPEEIIDKTICVKFFEPSQNQDGSWSLRFPVLKAIYEGERDI